MAIQKITVYQNDNNIRLIFNIKKDNIVESILGAIIKFQLINSKTGETIKKECVITDPTSGECVYVLTSNDLSKVATYKTEMQIIYSNGTKLTYPNPVIISVLPEIVPD